MSYTDELQRLHALHQAGALSDAEFEQAKATLLTSAGEIKTQSSAATNTLRRSKSDRWLGGVCGGIAKATGLESWMWRLMFVACVLYMGFGCLAYVLAWIFIPEENDQ